MSKYTEALRKIEEGRIRQVSISGPQPSGFKWGPYALGISVLFVVITIAIYSYGVYRGRRVQEPPQIFEPPVSPSPVQQVSQTNHESMLLENVEKMMKMEAPPSPTVPTQLSAQANPEEFYTVQLVTSRDESLAKAEAAKLAAKGYKVFIFRSDTYFKVCVGKYTGQVQAETVLQELSRDYGTTYPSAFVRFVRKKKPLPTQA